MGVDLLAGLDVALAGLGRCNEHGSNLLLLDLASGTLLRGGGRTTHRQGCCDDGLFDRLLDCGDLLVRLFRLGRKLGDCAFIAVVSVVGGRSFGLGDLGGEVGDDGVVVLHLLCAPTLLGPESGKLCLACGGLLDDRRGRKITQEVRVVLADQALGGKVLLDRGGKLLVGESGKVFGKCGEQRVHDSPQ